MNPKRVKFNRCHKHNQRRYIEKSGYYALFIIHQIILLTSTIKRSQCGSISRPHNYTAVSVCDLFEIPEKTQRSKIFLFWFPFCLLSVGDDEDSSIFLKDKILVGDTRLVPFQNGSTNLKKVQIKFHQTWYSVCGDLEFFYGTLGPLEHLCSLNADIDVDSDNDINSTYVVLLTGLSRNEYLTITEGNCEAYGMSETRYFCQKSRWPKKMTCFGLLMLFHTS